MLSNAITERMPCEHNFDYFDVLIKYHAIKVISLVRKIKW